MEPIRFIVEKITWKDLEDSGYASVTDYCRYLVANDPDNLPNRIEVYRGEMLCLTVTDVKLAAEIEPASRGWQKHTPKRASNGRGRVKMNRG